MKRKAKRVMTLGHLQAIQRVIRRVLDEEHKKLHYQILSLFSENPDLHKHQAEILKNLMSEDRFLKEAEIAMCDLFDMQFQQE